MIHQQIKELFFLLWNTLFLIFHSMLSIPIPISREAKKSLPRNLFPFSFHKAHLPPGLKCFMSFMRKYWLEMSLEKIKID